MAQDASRLNNLAEELLALGALPADFLPQVTERFRRQEGSRSAPGTGLGLALVDAILTAHNGQLCICADGVHHRRPGPAALDAQPCLHPLHGTTVSLLLPVD